MKEIIITSKLIFGVAPKGENAFIIKDFKAGCLLKESYNYQCNGVTFTLNKIEFSPREEYPHVMTF